MTPDVAETGQPCTGPPPRKTPVTDAGETPIVHHRTALADDTMVTLSLREYARLRHLAACWRRWWSPDMVELRQEQAAWEERRKFRDCSSAISGGANWSAISAAPSYAELVRLRAGAVVPRRCATAGCRHVLSVPYPAPAQPLYCPRHSADEVTA